MSTTVFCSINDSEYCSPPIFRFMKFSSFTPVFFYHMWVSSSTRPNDTVCFSHRKVKMSSGRWTLSWCLWVSMKKSSMPNPQPFRWTTFISTHHVRKHPQVFTRTCRVFFCCRRRGCLDTSSQTLLWSSVRRRSCSWPVRRKWSSSSRWWSPKATRTPMEFLPSRCWSGRRYCHLLPYTCCLATVSARLWRGSLCDVGYFDTE